MTSGGSGGNQGSRPVAQAVERSRTHRLWPLLLLAWLAALMAGCGTSESDTGARSGEETLAAAVRLGPADGTDLPPTDLERVGVGSVAPDFTLLALSGDTVTLSSFRGKKNVVLVFYRGHW